MEYAGEAVIDVGSTGMREQRAGWTEAAFEAAFFEHYPRMVSIVQRMLGDRARAEELASDAFVRLYQQPAGADRCQNLGGWLYRTASRLAIDALRAAERRRRYEPPAGEQLAAASAGGGPLDSLLQTERAGHVRAALGTLKPIQAQILTLRASGLAYKELAGALGVKPTSVGRLLARAEVAFEKAYRRIQRGPHGGLLSRLG
jgi:RNA polymerase sigma-70 factor (ECF subfamily)